jgi:putative oxygen-independent coproporphyrinogen III oxidase
LVSALPDAVARRGTAPLPLPPLSLYVHLPWCVRKCPYCDFNSYTLHGELPEPAYIDALLADLAVQRSAIGQRAIASVFFGGGTPSLFSPAGLRRLLTALRAELVFAGDAEITLEANPGTIEHGRFADYRAAGINRVSMGAQSFDDAALQVLGRIHAAGDTRRAVQELRQAGIDNFNLDLMYALPRQDPAAALADVQYAIELEPTHISHYELTLEPGTVFGGMPPAGLPDDDAALEMQLVCQQRLAQAGYAQYEVSAYAREGSRCHHNLNYWRFGDYVGLGAGAHGKLSRRIGTDMAIERTWREREPRRYLAGAAAEPARRTVLNAELPFEYLMNALRLREGFAAGEFEAATGLAAAVLAEPMARLGARGLIEDSAGRWRASARGYRFLNDVLTEFLSPPC